jgi:hypothetical protein
MKSTIDWQLVRMRFEAGQTAYRISTDLGGRPTKQGIGRRAKVEGWVKGNGNALTVATELPIVKRALALAGPSKATAERLAFVLDLVARGSSEALASTAAGINKATLRRWKHDDPQLAEQLRQARAGKLADWIGCIDDATSRDWKAADRLLQQASDATDWQAQEHGGIQVLININRDQVTVDPAKPEVISDQ